MDTLVHDGQQGRSRSKMDLFCFSSFVLLTFCVSPLVNYCWTLDFISVSYVFPCTCLLKHTESIKHIYTQSHRGVILTIWAWYFCNGCTFGIVPVLRCRLLPRIWHLGYYWSCWPVVNLCQSAQLTFHPVTEHYILILMCVSVNMPKKEIILLYSFHAVASAFVVFIAKTLKISDIPPGRCLGENLYRAV